MFFSFEPCRHLGQYFREIREIRSRKDACD